MLKNRRKNPIIVAEMIEVYQKGRLWWVLLVTGLLFIGSTFSGFFDPTEETRNTYNYIELFAETPTPDTIQTWINMFLGLFGILSILVLEYAFSADKTIRAIISPIHLFLCVLACIGFLLLSLTSIRTLELMPDLSHHYFAGDGQRRHAAAIAAELIPYDRNGWFLYAGNGCWCMYLTVENLIEGRTSRLLGITGLLLALALLLLLVFMEMDIGTYTSILSVAITVILAPSWFIGMAVHLRRLRSGNS
jgi:hypothetical protein